MKQLRNTKSPIAEAAVRQIAALYAVEDTVRGMPPEDRLAARKEHSAPIIATLRPWFEKQLSMISSGSTLANDIRYALSHWQGLTRFLEDGRLSPTPTRSRSPSGRLLLQERMHFLPAMKSAQKIGRCWPRSSPRASSTLLTPSTILEAILNGHPQGRIEDLMRWRFRKTSSRGI